MGLSLNSLQILASLNLSTEQMAGVVRVLTVELAPLEHRREKDRARKLRGYRAADFLRNLPGNSADEPSRVGNLSSSTEIVETVRKNLPLSPSRPSDLSEHPAWLAFWNIYPKRAGDRDRKGALKAFGPALKRAPSPEAIVEGAQRYAEYCDIAGKTGTEFVKQARSWLNADGWTETYEISRSTINGSSIRDSWAIASAVLAEQDRREGIRREGSEDDLRALPEPQGRP